MQTPDFSTYETCLQHASFLQERGYYVGEMDLFQIADLLHSLEEEKREKEQYTDSLIDYNDEIVSIEPIGVVDTIDITVSGDNLFYCKDILTKNSIGLPQTLDFFFALISNEELEETGQLMVKILKNRWNDPNFYKRFMIGIERAKFSLSDSDDPGNDLVDTGRYDTRGNKKDDDKPLFDRSSFGKRMIDTSDIDFD